MPAPADHRGVAQDDPRNRGPIAFFKPQDVAAESARESLSRSLPRASAADIETRVRQVMARVAGGPIKPPAPLSQSLQDVDDPLYGLGTHPDIIEHLRKLDDSLPEKCGWVFWGRPSLVHPKTGVIFAVGFGTIGIVMRLPPHILESADPKQAKAVVSGNPGQTFDIGTAGPEWRFVVSGDHAPAWCRAAYDFAGEPPQPHRPASELA